MLQLASSGESVHIIAAVSQALLTGGILVVGLRALWVLSSQLTYLKTKVSALDGMHTRLGQVEVHTAELSRDIKYVVKNMDRRGAVRV